MAIYAVEHLRKGFWTPVMLCRLRPDHFRKFLRWLETECVHGEFDTPFDDIRVKRERDNVKPNWAYDGVSARLI